MLLLLWCWFQGQYFIDHAILVFFCMIIMIMDIIFEKIHLLPNPSTIYLLYFVVSNDYCYELLYIDGWYFNGFNGSKCFFLKTVQVRF